MDFLGETDLSEKSAPFLNVCIASIAAEIPIAGLEALNQVSNDFVFLLNDKLV